MPNGFENVCVLCAYWRSDGKDGAWNFIIIIYVTIFFGEYIYNKIKRILINDVAENVDTFFEVYV